MLIASVLILTNGLLLLNITLLTQMIQSSILFVNLGTSMNEGGDVDDGAGGSFELAIPTSRAVTVRDEDGVSIHPYVSKQEENKDVPWGPNLSLSKADDGDDGVSSKVQDTVDVSTLAHCLLKLLGILFLIHSLHYLPDCYL
jgi:hypothetical protein